MYADEDNPRGLTYIIPRSNVVILGGSSVNHELSVLGPPSLHCSEETWRGIFERCCAVVPALRSSKLVRRWSGLRPCRRGGVRLELVGSSMCMCAVRCRSPQLTPTFRQDTASFTIHNYGHGGAGMTVAWGCARRVAQLAAEAWRQRGARL